ncbi:MAG: ATP-binding protein [Proteobacteria bacterium]|nr:ATP-binding protein [Pseudomonadota bacterium]
MKKRGYYRDIWKEFDNEKHLILVSGPRQSGKTTFSRHIASFEPVSDYLNYDIPTSKAKFLKNPLFFESLDREKGQNPLVILDEIHKYKDWKNYLKGIYDGYSNAFRFLVTGSGRLDLLRNEGDSLAGRYRHFYFFPFTIGELFFSSIGGFTPDNVTEPPETNLEAQETWETMFQTSGFPEPLLKGTQTVYRRWSKSYHTQIIRNDIRDEFAVKQIDAMESLYILLSDCIGSPMSTSNHAGTLKVSYKTVSSWLAVFERFFLLFRIRPYSQNIPRSLLKEPKYYFYDFCRVQDAGFRFENMVAVELYRAITLWNDYGIGDYELRFLRNKEKEEVDFLITDGGRPLFLLETKQSNPSVSPHLIKFQNRLNIPAVQLVNQKGINRLIKNNSNSILITSAANWLCRLQ